MEQQQFKVSFSVGTKLLISVLTLLAVVVAFLNISAIFLLREDKRAYTYQSQSIGAVLAGREFVNTAKHQLDTLRVALGSMDPTKPLTLQQGKSFESFVANQSDLLGISISLLNSQNGAMTQVVRSVRDKEMQSLDLSEKDIQLTAERAQAVLSELIHNSFAFVNLSRLDGTSLLGVLVADLKLVSNPGGIPVALGIATLKNFGSELSGLNLTIATKSGWILFDTDPTALFSGKNMKEDPLFQIAVSSKLSSGAQEYDADDKHYLASYVQPGLDLLVFSKVDWKKAIRATYDLIIKFGLLGLMAVGVALIFSVVFSKTLTRPINRLYEATREIAQGNFDLNIKVKSHDEIGALTGSFNVMSRQISELMRSQADKIHLENEMEIASTVQQTLIPPSNFSNSDIYIHSRYQAASQCGGDWWGFFGVGKKLCIMIADATGHGMPSALITASARSCFSVMHKLAQEDPDFSFSPSAMLAYANRVVFDASLGKIMMTFYAGVIDFETMTLTYSSAGHNPPWLFKKQGDEFKLQSLVVNGLRLGETRDAPPFEEKTVDVEPGDILFLYTDGLMEGKNVAGDMYGKKRLRQLVEANLKSGPEIVIKQLMTDFLKYNQGKPLDDDVTLATALILDNPANGLKRGTRENAAPPAEVPVAAVEAPVLAEVAITPSEAEAIVLDIVIEEEPEKA